MPAYCALELAALKMDRLALSMQISMARLSSRALASCPPSDIQRPSSVLMKVVAMALATSPALYPPMPSASTAIWFSGSRATESSLLSLTRPGSVRQKYSKIIWLEL